jgi:hypothetical protein
MKILMLTTLLLISDARAVENKSYGLFQYLFTIEQQLTFCESTRERYCTRQQHTYNDGSTKFASYTTYLNCMPNLLSERQEIC